MSYFLCHLFCLAYLLSFVTKDCIYMEVSLETRREKSFFEKKVVRDSDTQADIAIYKLKWPGRRFIENYKIWIQIQININKYDETAVKNMHNENNDKLKFKIWRKNFKLNLKRYILKYKQYLYLKIEIIIYWFGIGNFWSNSLNLSKRFFFVFIIIIWQVTGDSW